MILGKKVVIECKNNGTDAAKSVEASAIFTKEGKMVGYGSTYLTDNDLELKPGKVIASDIESYEPYDEVKVFVSGYKSR